MKKFNKCRLILFIVVFWFNIINSYAKENYKLQNLIRYNQYLSTLYPNVGKGLLGGRYNLEFQKLIMYPNGSCAQRGYLLARKAKELGFKKVQMLGLFAKSGANDVMVNVFTNKERYLFVPSAGAYYKCSLWDILLNIKNAENFIAKKTNNKQVLSSRILYLSKKFFSNLKQIKFYSLNNYEYNLLKLAKKISSKGLFDEPYNEKHLLDFINKYYTAGKSQSNEQSITYIFEKPIKIYRIYFKWYSDKDYAKKIIIIINDNIKKILEVKFTNGENEFILKNPIKNIRKIKFIFKDFHGQKRLLLKQLGVY